MLKMKDDFAYDMRSVFFDRSIYATQYCSGYERRVIKLLIVSACNIIGEILVNVSISYSLNVHFYWTFYVTYLNVLKETPLEMT